MINKMFPSFIKSGERIFFQHQIPLNLPFSKGEIARNTRTNLDARLFGGPPKRREVFIWKWQKSLRQLFSRALLTFTW
jgi:hypothetical protein